MSIANQYGLKTAPQDPKLKGVSLPAGNPVRKSPRANRAPDEPANKLTANTPELTSPANKLTAPANGLTREAFERLRDRVSELAGAVEILVARVEVLEAAQVVRPSEAAETPKTIEPPSAGSAEARRAYQRELMRKRRAAAKGGAS